MYSRSCTSSLSRLAVESALAGRAVRLIVPGTVDQAIRFELVTMVHQHEEGKSEKCRGALHCLLGAVPARPVRSRVRMASSKHEPVRMNI